MYKAHKMASKTKPPREEVTLALDWDIVDACNGFTFDMGGSVMKVVYISKDDWVEPSKRKKGSKGCLRLVNFSREEIDEAVNYINTKARMIKNPTTGLVDIYSSGYGGTQFADKFKKELHVNQTMVSEADGFVQALMHLVKNFPRKDVLYPFSKEIFQAISEEMAAMLPGELMTQESGETAVYDDPVFEKLKEPFQFPDPDATDPDKPLTENKDLFPCILMMLGSGYAAFVVNADGSFHMADMSMRGGRLFLGLGSLLTGGKAYPDLMKLSEKGDLSKVTVTMKSLQDEVKQEMGAVKEDKSDIYQQFLDVDADKFDFPMFSFGHAAGKSLDDFKREDLMRALLHIQVNDVVQVAHTAAVVVGAKHVFFAGGFANNAFAREMFSIEWLRRDGIMAITGHGKKNHIKGHFMVHAQSLGAIGALLNHKFQWYEKRKAKASAKPASPTGSDINTEIKNTVGL